MAAITWRPSTRPRRIAVARVTPSDQRSRNAAAWPDTWTSARTGPRRDQRTVPEIGSPRTN